MMGMVGMVRTLSLYNPYLYEIPAFPRLVLPFHHDNHIPKNPNETGGDFYGEYLREGEKAKNLWE